MATENTVFEFLDKCYQYLGQLDNLADDRVDIDCVRHWIHRLALIVMPDTAKAYLEPTVRLTKINSKIIALAKHNCRLAERMVGQSERKMANELAINGVLFRLSPEMLKGINNVHQPAAGVGGHRSTTRATHVQRGRPIGGRKRRRMSVFGAKRKTRRSADQMIIG